MENSQTIYNDALSIYRKIYNLESPNVETKHLTDKALSLSRDADRLKTDAATILDENEVKNGYNFYSFLRTNGLLALKLGLLDLLLYFVATFYGNEE